MIHLTRVDPARNMARFYRLSLARDLFEGWQLVREWGRIGQAGTVHCEAFASEADAVAALQSLAACKRRRGYDTP